MAKSSSGKTATPSRIRFVMVEAEIGDGDIGQITQAIQNALRTPAAPTAKRIATTNVTTSSPLEPEVESEEEIEEEPESLESSPSRAKVRTVRKPSPTPDIVDLDMNAHVSLAEFAKGKDSSSQHKKYLIAAAWLKEHRKINAVSSGHIYTCFRSLSWSTNIPDFMQPFRDLKRRKYFGKNDQGEYEINHLGLDYVNKLSGSNGTG